MPRWVREFKAKDLLTDEDVPDERAAELGHEMARRIQALRPFTAHWNHHLAEAFGDIVSQEHFNEVLNELYDVADDQRVWVC